MSLSLLGATMATSTEGSGSCSVGQPDDYYGVELEETFDLRWEADAIARGLFRDPLMRQGDAFGIGDLKRRLQRIRISVGRIQATVKGHLYGSSAEFENLLNRLVQGKGDDGAAVAIRRSIYDAFDYLGYTLEEAEIDECLIQSGRAHLVATKCILDFLSPPS